MDRSRVSSQIERERAMYSDTDKFVDLDFEQRVRQAAYHLWEKDGRPWGREKDYWFEALAQELAAREKGDGNNNARRATGT